MKTLRLFTLNRCRIYPEYVFCWFLIQKPIRKLFKAIEENYKNVDDSGKDFIQSGIIEVLETSTNHAGLDSKTCYKMLLNQEVIRLWNNIL